MVQNDAQLYMLTCLISQLRDDAEKLMLLEAPLDEEVNKLMAQRYNYIRKELIFASSENGAELLEKFSTELVTSSPLTMSVLFHHTGQLARLADYNFTGAQTLTEFTNSKRESAIKEKHLLLASMDVNAKVNDLDGNDRVVYESLKNNIETYVPHQNNETDTRLPPSRSASSTGAYL